MITDYRIMKRWLHVTGLHIVIWQKWLTFEWHKQLRSGTNIRFFPPHFKIDMIPKCNCANISIGDWINIGHKTVIFQIIPCKFSLIRKQNTINNKLRLICFELSAHVIHIARHPLGSARTTKKRQNPYEINTREREAQFELS